jgi:hypothetical protein
MKATAERRLKSLTNGVASEEFVEGTGIRDIHTYRTGFLL